MKDSLRNRRREEEEEEEEDDPRSRIKETVEICPINELVDCYA